MEKGSLKKGDAAKAKGRTGSPLLPASAIQWNKRRAITNKRNNLSAGKDAHDNEQDHHKPKRGPGVPHEWTRLKRLRRESSEPWDPKKQLWGRNGRAGHQKPTERYADGTRNFRGGERQQSKGWGKYRGKKTSGGEKYRLKHERCLSKEGRKLKVLWGELGGGP